MEKINFNVKVKELNGGTRISKVEIDETNQISYENIEPEPQVTVNDINSGEATKGQLLMADGEGKATWSDPNLPELPSDSADGIYVLKASKTGDNIVYSWELA